MLQANHNTSEWLYSGYVQYKSKPRVLYHNYCIMYLFAQLRKRMHSHALGNGDLLWRNPWAMCKWPWLLAVRNAARLCFISAFTAKSWVIKSFHKHPEIMGCRIMFGHWALWLFRFVSSHLWQFWGLFSPLSCSLASKEMQGDDYCQSQLFVYTGKLGHLKKHIYCVLLAEEVPQ